MPPALKHTDYYNRKGWYSIVLQAVVDHQYLFRDVCVGWPGSVHDAHVFCNSGIYRRITEQNLLHGESIVIDELEIPLFLIGDSAYPLSTFLMKPFPHNSIVTPAQKNLTIIYLKHALL